MPAFAEALAEPIALLPNRAPRFYRGGRLLGAFRGDPEAADDERPEDWVGSATRIWTPPGATPSGAGPSEVNLAGTRIGLDELVVREPEALVGEALASRIGPSLGLLVKLLDAAERLPVHAHPTRKAARRLLSSAFGKTEAWFVLATRDEAQPRVWAGFRDPIPRATLGRWIDEQRTDALLEALVPYEVAAGDAFLIPGGTPHAIGAGIFLLELQEPTDFSIVAETSGYPIDPSDASLGLGWDAALELFETGASGDLRQRPARSADGATRLLEPAADPYFRALRLTVQGERTIPDGSTFAIGIVLGGSGEVRGRRTALALDRGSTFLVPAEAARHARLWGDGLDLICCLPPDPRFLPNDFG